MRRILKILAWSLGSIVLLLIVLYSLLRLPSIQTWGAKKVVNVVSSQLGGNINIGKVKIVFFNQAVVNDLCIVAKNTPEELRRFKLTHSQSDTLLYIKEIRVSFSLKSLLQKEISITSVKIYDGVFNLEQETENQTNIDRIFPKTEPKPKNPDSNPLISLKKLEVDNFTFTLNNPFQRDSLEDPNQINFKDLHVSNINVSAEGIRYTKDSIAVIVNNISGHDKSGFEIQKLKGKLSLTAHKAMLKEMLLSDGHTKIEADYLSLGYATSKSMKYFTDSVMLGLKMHNSVIDFSTIGKISKGLKGSTLALYNVNGEISGYVRDLHSKTLTAGAGGMTAVTLQNVAITGLAGEREARISADISSITTTGPSLATVLSTLTGSDRVKFFDGLPSFDHFRYQGRLQGSFNDLNVNGTLSFLNGAVSSDINVNTKDKGGAVITAVADAEQFDLKALTGAQILGAFTGRAGVKVKTGGETEILIDSLRVREIGLNDYNFSNIYAVGKYTNEFFDGRVICHDPNLDFMFQGAVSTTLKGDTKYKFYANIPYANLAAAKLDKRDSVSILSLAVNADIRQRADDGFLGSVRIDNPAYTNSLGSFSLGRIEAKSTKKNGLYVIEFLSDFARARYAGNHVITQFIKDVKRDILQRHLSNFFSNNELQQTEGEPRQKDYHFTLQTFNTQGICALLAPGLYIQSGTSCVFKFSGRDRYRMTLGSGRIALKENYLRNINLTIENRDTLLNASLFSKDAVAAGFKVDSTRLTARGTANRFDIRVRFHNDTTGVNNTRLNAGVTFLKDTVILHNGEEIKLNSPIDLKVKESEIKIKGNTWRSAPSEILLGDSLILCKKLNIYNGNQSLLVDGSLSKTLKDSLGIKMDKFNIAILDQFLSQSFKLEGLISGSANISLNKGTTKMFASFTGDSVYVYDTPVGSMRLLGRWASQDKRYNILLDTRYKNISPLKLAGFYKPDDNFLNIKLALDDFSLSYFEPLLSSVVNHIGGSLDGSISLSGPPDKLVLSGEKCRFNDFKFTLGFTNVPYTINGPFEVGENGIKLMNCVITDNAPKKANGNSSKGILSGGVTYKHFKDIKADVNIALSNLLALNTTEKENESFYGTAYASGNVKIKGTPDKMDLLISATTEPNTLVHIPIPHTSTASTAQILKFVQKPEEADIDPYDTLFFVKPKQQEPMELNINLQLNATPQADVWLEVDKSTGDIIKAKGAGRVGINVNPKRDIFALSGNYVIESGSYHFVLMGLATRDFEVQGGSSVAFNGAIENTMLDLAAIYKTKASINTLISDTSSVSTMRAVYSSIIAKGKLSNPEIKFKIDIPDLDPSTKIKVESALNSDDKIQKQFAALIASGGFVPDAQSGITSNSTMLYSNASEMLSNQINNIFTQLGIPLDLGLSYQPGDNSRNDAYDFALSLQFWHNRITVNGNIGNNPYSDESGNAVMGNADLELKLDRKGKLRLSAFTHATDKYSNYLDESQRTGLGIAYQHEFNSFKDLWRKKSAKQREYERMLKANRKAQKREEKAKKQR